MLLGFSMYPLKALSQVAPTAPSTTLWSADSVTFIMVACFQAARPGSPAPPASGTTRFSAVPTAKMSAWG